MPNAWVCARSLDREGFKLGTMCDSAAWHSEADMLAAVIDGKLMVWYYSNVVFIDRDLVNQTKLVKEAADLGKDPQIQSFHGTHVVVRRSDGAQLSFGVSPYPITLYGIVARSMWEPAIHLCRCVKDSTRCVHTPTHTVCVRARACV